MFWAGQARVFRVVCGVLVLVVLMSSVRATTDPGRARAERDPVTVAGTENEASRAAREQGSRVRVASRTSPTTQVFANPDGTFAMEQSSVPERVRRGGSWVDIDTTLVRRDGAIVPRAVVANVRFSAGGDDPLVRLSGRGASVDATVELGWKGDLPQPRLSGDTATYPEVYPGVDLRVRATPRGIAHEIVVKSREAAASPELRRVTFDLRTEGVRVERDRAGNLRAVDTGGRTVFAAGAPMMWDSSDGGEQAQSFAGAQGKRSESPVEVDVGDGMVSLTPDGELLSAEDTRFPVVIDPDFSYVTPEQSAWTLVRRSHPDQSHWNLVPRDDDERYAGVARAGHAPGWPADYLDRSLFRFDTRAIKGARISKAQFQVFQAWKYANTCDASLVPPVQLWLTTGISSATTWNNQPNWIRKIAQVRSVPKAGQSCGPDWVGMNAHSAVQESADKKWNGVTLGLKAASGDESSNNPAAWKRFHVKKQDGVRLYPKLFIEYNRRPHQPQNAWVEPWNSPCHWCGGTPYVGGDEVRLKTRLTDPDGGQLRAVWDIYTPEHQSRDQWLASDSVFSTPLDLRGLHGATVQWQVRGNDGSLDGPRKDGPGFVVDREPPGSAPGVSSGVYPADNDWHGGADVPGQFTFTPNDVSDVDHYVYGFQDPPTTEVNADELGGEATVTLTPPSDGPVDLYVQSVDRAGNRSPVTTHHFYVRAGNGPLGHWALDGDPADSAMLGDRDGTLHGDPSWTTGAVGAGVRLDDATGDHITAPNTVATDDSFSVSAWVRPHVAGGHSRSAVSQDGEQVSGFTLMARHDQRWAFVLAGTDEPGGGDDMRFAASDVLAHPEQWTHLTGVHDARAGEIRLYVNGTLAASTPYGGGVRVGGDLAIGRSRWDGSGSRHWKGAIDEVRIYDRIISGAEIRSLVSLDNVRTGHWQFEDTGNGDTVSNTVPGGEPATLHGGANYGADGAVGRAVRLDGTDDYAGTGEPVMRTDGAFSVAAWVRLREKPADPVAVASQNSSRNSAFVLGYAGDDTDRWTWTMRGPDDQEPPEYTAVRSASDVQAGVWTHLVGVYQMRSGEMRLYVNGELVGTSEFTSAWHTTGGDFAIGRGKNGGNWVGYWPGAVDEVRTYSRALTRGEIRGIVSQDDVTAGSWALDGDVADGSGSGLDGAAHGDPAWTGGQTVHPDHDDRAVLLDGSDDHLSAPRAVDTDDSFAVAVWAKPDRIGDRFEVLSQDGERVSGFQLRATPDGKWAFAMFDEDVDGGGTRSRVVFAQPAQADVWTHLVGMYDADAGRIHLYVNGEHAGEVEHDSTWNARGELRIGRGQWNGSAVDFWPGAIDDVKIYSRVLFEEDIRMLAGRDLNLVHNLRMDENTGDTAADSAGAQPGTLHNGASFQEGRSGNAVSLDGSDDYVSTSVVDLRTDESFTVSTWVYLSDKDKSKATAVSVDGANTSKFRLGHVQNDENPFGAWVFEMPESDTDSAAITEAALSTLESEVNTWTHLTGVYDVTTGKLWLYVNGERVGDGTLDKTWNATGGLQIGKGKDAGSPAEFWPGAIDDVRMYTGRLAADRVASLYDYYGDTG